MQVQWCPECHWETDPGVFSPFGFLGTRFGDQKKVCPVCGYTPLLKVENGK